MNDMDVGRGESLVLDNDAFLKVYRNIYSSLSKIEFKFESDQNIHWMGVT